MMYLVVRFDVNSNFHWQKYFYKYFFRNSFLPVTRCAFIVTGSQGKCNSRTSSPSTNTQVATGEGFEDRQFVVLASEKQARVVALPSQNCQYRQQLAESHIVIKAEITSLKGMYRKYPFFS